MSNHRALYHGVMPDHPDPELAPWYPEMAGSPEASIFDNTADINIDSIIPNTNLDIPKPAKTMENEIPTAVSENYYNKPDSEYGFDK